MGNRRRSGGRNGGRGRGRGILTVRDAAYSLPISEPCNFVEASVRFNGVSANSSVLSVTWGQIAGAMIQSGVASPFSVANNIRKLRITSLVVEPFTGSSTGALEPDTPDIVLLLSGNHYSPGTANKPLRIKLSNIQGSDGEWKRVELTSEELTSPHLLNGFGQLVTTETVFARLDFGRTVSSATGDIRFRIAFTDNHDQVDVD